MIIIHASLHVLAVKQEAFLKEIQSLIITSRQESGNISYRLQKDTEDTNIFTMIEVWEDMKAVASHNSSTHFKDFTDQAKDFLAAPIKIDLYQAEALNL